VKSNVSGWVGHALIHLHDSRTIQGCDDALSLWALSAASSLPRAFTVTACQSLPNAPGNCTLNSLRRALCPLCLYGFEFFVRVSQTSSTRS
jgi:hypothetical protein